MLEKNMLIPLTIESIGSEGAGVGRFEGMPVFVPFSTPGDRLTVRIVKALSSHAFGIIEEILSPSPERVVPKCPVFGKCGGCSLRHVRYSCELEAKESWVRENMRRIGKLDCPVLPILPSPSQDGYRNKGIYPIQKTERGIEIGFYARRSHRVINSLDCPLHPPQFGRVVKAVRQYLGQSGASIYDETAHRGLVRSLYLRRGEATGELMVCLVINARSPGAFKHPERFVEAVRAAEPEVSTVLLNLNPQRTNVVLGPKWRTLFGSGVLRDKLLGMTFEISPESFYQVNRRGAEQLYSVAAQMVALTGRESLLDLYCGVGTIGLTMAAKAKNLAGVEIVEAAAQNARKNAALNGVSNAVFFGGRGAEEAVPAMEAASMPPPDVVVLDPPRKGCDKALIASVARMGVKRIVMISCNSATAARDAAAFARLGYRAELCQPVDMFPRTAHVETVVLLSQQKPDDTIEIDLDLDELDATAAETKATYEEIKAYVWDKHHLKVSSLYISQIKRKCGLEIGQNYNLSKSENPKVPKCPPEKEAAIMGALKHFQMI